MSQCKLFQTIKRIGHTSSYKKPAQFCRILYYSVEEAIKVFIQWLRGASWFKSEDGWSFKQRKLASAYGALDKI